MRKLVALVVSVFGVVVLLVAAAGAAAVHADGPDPSNPTVPACVDHSVPDGALVCIDVEPRDPNPQYIPQVMIPYVPPPWTAQPDHDTAPAVRYCPTGGPTYPTADGCAPSDPAPAVHLTAAAVAAQPAHHATKTHSTVAHVQRVEAFVMVRFGPR